MILRGTVQPLSLPCFKAINRNIRFRSPTPDPPENVDDVRKINISNKFDGSDVKCNFEELDGIGLSET